MICQEKTAHKVQITERKRNIIQQFIEEYNIELAQDIQDVLKNLLGESIKEMMEAEIDEHIGHQKFSVIYMILELLRALSTMQRIKFCRGSKNDKTELFPKYP